MSSNIWHGLHRWQLAELKKLFDVLEINPALLDNPNDRDEGVKQLLKKAQETSNAAVLVNQKLNNGFELWNEPLVDAQHLIAMQKSLCSSLRMNSAIILPGSILRRS